MTQEKIRKIDFRLRIYDEEVLQNLEVLLNSDQFDSMNDLLSRLVKFGAEEFLVKFGKKRALAPIEVKEIFGQAKLNEMAADLKSVKMTNDDIFVILNIIETLVSTLFNVRIEELSGNPINVELVNSGYLSELPEMVAEVKQEMIKRYTKKKKESQHA